MEKKIIELEIARPEAEERLAAKEAEERDVFLEEASSSRTRREKTAGRLSSQSKEEALPLTRAARRKKRKKERMMRALKVISVIFGILIALIIAGLLIYYLCTIKTVHVTGCTKYSDQEIEERILNDEYSFNSVYVFFKNKLQPVTDIPFIESYAIILDKPSEITIAVTEKELFAYVVSGEGMNVYFNGDGVVQEISERLIPEVLLLDGISCEEAAVGESLPVDETTLLGVLTLVKNLRKYEIPFENLTFDARGALWITCDTVRVDFGDVSNIAEKVTRLHIILPKITGNTGILHLEDWTKEHTDIIFEKTG